MKDAADATAASFVYCLRMAAAPTAAGQKALRTALQTRIFDPVYYLHGAEDYLKDEMLKQLLEAAVEPATREFNLETLRGAEITGEELGSLLGTPPMMAERRVVVVRDVGALRKDARRALDMDLEKPAREGGLVLIAAAGTKDDRLLIDRATTIEFDTLSGARVPKWISYYA